MFVIKTHTHIKEALNFLKKKTAPIFSASTCASLLVMLNLDQTIKIIYKTLAIEEKTAQSFNFPFKCQSHLLRNSMFAISADVRSSVSLLRFLKRTVLACQFETDPASI